MAFKIHIDPQNEDWLSEKNRRNPAEGKEPEDPKGKGKKPSSVRVAERFRLETQEKP